MEQRAHKRYIPRKEVLVALFLQSGEHIAVIGRLIDISQSGLALTHLPLDDTIIPVKTPCEVMLKLASRPFTKPFKCEIVNGTQLDPDTSDYFLHPLNRYGIRFTSLPSVSDLREIIAA